MFPAYKEPILYNAAVARELAKQIYVAENLRPPTSLATIQDAYSTLWSRASNLQYWRGILANGEFVRVGIYGLEAYGIFKVCNTHFIYPTSLANALCT